MGLDFRDWEITLKMFSFLNKPAFFIFFAPSSASIVSQSGEQPSARGLVTSALQNASSPSSQAIKGWLLPLLSQWEFCHCLG